jgi:thiamine kinase-like enzyme
MRELWMALAEHAESRFGQSIGASVRTLQRRMITEVGSRWRCLEHLPRTLIHNDFNPRNIALRCEGDRLRLCSYDWELATLGVPQHDLAEFLCFVLKPTLDRAETRHYLDLHRSALERASNRSIEPRDWETGFRLSLHDLLIDRFALYAMIDRFRPQRFLTRVVSTWHALYELFPLEEAGSP